MVFWEVRLVERLHFRSSAYAAVKSEIVRVINMWLLIFLVNCAPFKSTSVPGDENHFDPFATDMLGGTLKDFQFYFYISKHKASILAGIDYIKH